MTRKERYSNLCLYTVVLTQQSRDPVQQAVYRGLMTFSKDDPEVLSLDPEVHLAKVLEGGFAFIGDSPTLDTWVRKHCDIQVLEERVLGLELYTVYTQKNMSLTAGIDRV